MSTVFAQAAEDPFLSWAELILIGSGEVGAADETWRPNRRLFEYYC